MPVTNRRILKPWIFFYERMKRDIAITAYNQRIPGMSTDDVEQEMLMVLYRAWQTFDPYLGTTLPQYWWSIWMHHKANLIARQFRAKRDITRELLTEEFDPLMDPYHDVWLDRVPLVTFDEILMPPPAPPGRESISQKVWRMVAAGMTGTDIMIEAKISKRSYYEIIQSWRTDEVRRMLTG